MCRPRWISSFTVYTKSQNPNNNNNNHHHHHHHHLMLYSIDASWLRDSEHPCHLSSFNENPLVGSTCAHEPATGDSSSFLGIVLLTDVIYSFIVTLSIIIGKRGE